MKGDLDMPMRMTAMYKDPSSFAKGGSGTVESADQFPVIACSRTTQQEDLICLFINERQFELLLKISTEDLSVYVIV